MKKLLFFAVCALFYLSACTNQNVAPSSGISATIDGHAEAFNTIDSAISSHRDSVYELSISARSSAADTADMIQLDLFTATPVATGTYTVTSNFNPPYGPLVILKPKSSSNFANDYVIDYTGAHQLSITITSVSSTNVQGTFSGTLVVAAGNSGATKTITDGKFNVNIK